MSENFGDAKRFPTMRRWSQQDYVDLYPEYSHMGNKKYNVLINDYFVCVSTFLNPFPSSLVLEQQLGRRDLDTVCAYELY